ncbi:MAG TPA: hypothetical protein VNK48_10150 [Xanthobacteraceae bacterium]|nr:hypothetical protein [Xanthobacteraceae bacterium]
MSHENHGMKSIVGERSRKTGWKVALAVAAMVILIVLASRSNVQPIHCSVSPAASFNEGVAKCG